MRPHGSGGRGSFLPVTNEGVASDSFHPGTFKAGCDGHSCEAARRVRWLPSSLGIVGWLVRMSTGVINGGKESCEVQKGFCMLGLAAGKAA